MATRLTEGRLSAVNKGWVSLVVLLETAWAMQSCYDADEASVIEILGDSLDTTHIEVQEAPAVRRAFVLFSAGKVDLHDCLIVAGAEQRNARVVTFDAKAAKRLGMALLH